MRQLLLHWILALMITFNTTHFVKAQSINIEGSNGFCMSNIKTFTLGNSNLNKKNILGVNYRLSIEIKVKNNLSIKTGVLYSRNGIKIKDTSFQADIFTIRNINFREHYNYFNFPILLKTSFGKKANLNLFFGAYFGFLYSTKFKGTQFSTCPQTPSTDYAEDINNKFLIKKDYGLEYGIGFAYPVSKHLSLTGDLLHYIGLKKVEMSSGTSFSYREFQNRLLNFMLGVQYRLK